jgi:mono/diheme cytochrome c family protein
MSEALITLLRSFLATAILVTVAGCGAPASPKGDPERGAKVHEVCLDCHGTALYIKPDRKIKSLDALRKDVVRWGDYYAPALSEQDVDDVTAYLNRDFYKF